MKKKKVFSRCIALIMCFQLLMISFAGNNVTYAAEGSGSEAATEAAGKEKSKSEEASRPTKSSEKKKEEKDNSLTRTSVKGPETDSTGKTVQETSDKEKTNDTKKDSDEKITKSTKNSDEKETKPAGDSDGKETKPTGNSDGKEIKPVGDSGGKETKPVGDSNGKETKPTENPDEKEAKQIEESDEEMEKPAEETANTKEESGKKQMEAGEETSKVKEEEETQEQATEGEKDQWNQSPISESASKDGVKIYVSAPKESFPEGTRLKISPIGDSSLSKLGDIGSAADSAVGFDITFTTSEGKRCQPRKGYHVDVRFEIGGSSKLADSKEEGTILRAYHINENGKAESLGSAEAPAKGDSSSIQIKADTFSPYIVTKDAPAAAGNDSKAETTSTNLSDFLVDILCNAPVDENGNYVIDPNESYEITLKFRENENLQFDNDAALTYLLPEALHVPDVGITSFDINIKDVQGNATVSNNTFEVSDGVLVVHFNQSDNHYDRLTAVANAAFDVSVSVRLDGSQGNIVFNSDLEKQFVFESNSDLEITKKVTYDSDSDTANYVLEVTSTGNNENVRIQDTITGTALTLNRDVSVESSINGTLSLEVDYSSISNGFVVSVPEMEDKEVLTIRCSASVDNRKITGNGTVEQTNNTAKVTSEQVPDGKEAKADFNGQLKFHRIRKQRSGELVQVGEKQYEQTWEIQVNNDHKIITGGTWISDWIVTKDRFFMMFTGDGITVKVTLEDGRTETRELSWNDLRLYTNSDGTYGWGYFTPESDGKASYVITCTTLINAANAQTDLYLSNGAQIYDSYDEAGTAVTGIGESVFAIEKKETLDTSTESAWEITVHVDGSGYEDFRVVDDFPRLTYEGRDLIDYLQEDTLEVDGLLDGEAYTLNIGSTRRTMSVYFYKDEEKKISGLRPTQDGKPRDIIIRFKTTVNQEWLELADASGYELYTRHRNNTSASAPGKYDSSNDSVYPRKESFRKEYAGKKMVEIDGTEYPVYQYTLTLSNPNGDTADIADTFDTTYLKYYPGDGISINGGNAESQNDSDGDISAEDTSDGIRIRINRFPKDKDGNKYSVYKVKYSLIVKDKAALEALNQAALEQNGYGLKNTATWNELTSDTVEVVHGYYPYVDKELVEAAAADNDYVAEFKLIINQDAADLDPESDTLAIQDELSANLRFIQDSLTISPEGSTIQYRFDSETNTLIFTEIPDNTRYEVTYQARVLGKGNVTYSNTVRYGKYEKTIEDDVKIDSSGSGSGSNPSITLVKRDAEDLNTTLKGAKFQLFYMNEGSRTAVKDGNGDNVYFTTGDDGKVLIFGNQSTLGWTLWEGRTYQLVEVEAPAGYELNNDPVSFVLSETPSTMGEYDLVGDQLDIQDIRIKTEVSVQKRWTGPAADSVTVFLKIGDDIIDTAVLNEENNWRYTFTGLDKFQNGKEIEYKVDEDPIEGYFCDINGNMDSGYIINNTKNEKVNIHVKKEWIGPAADSVTISLLADDTKIAEAELNRENNWQYTFENFEKYKDGNEITYKIEETELKGYVSKITGDVSGYIITNTNVETMDIPVTKKWEGGEGSSVTIRLYGDDKEIEEAALDKENDWKYVFDKLPLYDKEDGHKIRYTITEDPMDGYSSEIEGDAENGFVVTNTKEATPEKPETTTQDKPDTTETTTQDKPDTTETTTQDKPDTTEVTTQDKPDTTEATTQDKPDAAKTTTRRKSDTNESTTVKKNDTTRSSGTVKTGDENNIRGYLMILLVSAGLLILLWISRKKHSNTEK